MNSTIDVQRMIDNYADWMKQQIAVTRYGEYVELTTPFTDRFNDHLQIYVKQSLNGEMSLTDDGYIIRNLASSGVTFRTGTQKKSILDRILRSFSLQLNGDEITTTAVLKNFPLKKHAMIQAMLAIDDLYTLSHETVKNIFVEEVQVFLDANEIYYTKDFSLLGKTGSIITYDFLFQRSRQKPDRFCRAINSINENRRNMTIFNWIDTKEKRNDDSKLIVILNDENPIDSGDINAFNEYQIGAVKFSEREQCLDYFKAA